MTAPKNSVEFQRQTDAIFRGHQAHRERKIRERKADREAASWVGRAALPPKPPPPTFDESDEAA